MTRQDLKYQKKLKFFIHKQWSIDVFFQKKVSKAIIRKSFKKNRTLTHH